MKERENGRGFASSFQAAGRPLGDNGRPFLIAEMACSHQGSGERAQKLCQAAARAGLDAIQLQIFHPACQVHQNHELFPLLQRIAMGPEEWRRVHRAARETGLAVFAFAYDLPSLDLALELGVEGLKISSADLSFPALLSRAARSGLPLFLGAGGCSLEEIDQALDTVAASGGSKAVLMHGVQNFPTPFGEANLNRIADLAARFGLPVGYQDHTEAAGDLAKVLELAALGLGACCLEKHFTLSRAERLTDWQAALEPEELAQWATRMRQAARALGPGETGSFSPGDLAYRKFQKKGLVAVKDLAPGQVIGPDDLAVLRSGQSDHLPPAFLERVLGAKALVPIPAGRALTFDSVDLA